MLFCDVVVDVGTTAEHEMTVFLAFAGTARDVRHNIALSMLLVESLLSRRYIAGDSGA